MASGGSLGRVALVWDPVGEERDQRHGERGGRFRWAGSCDLTDAGRTEYERRACIGRGERGRATLTHVEVNQSTSIDASFSRLRYWLHPLQAPKYGTDFIASEGHAMPLEVCRVTVNRAGRRGEIRSRRSRSLQVPRFAVPSRRHSPRRLVTASSRVTRMSLDRTKAQGTCQMNAVSARNASLEPALS